MGGRRRTSSAVLVPGSGCVRVPVRPHLDVVLLQLQQHPVRHAQGRGVRQRRALLAAQGHREVRAGAAHGRPQRLRTEPGTGRRQNPGGQQQRVAIARALANSPALLLADEPTGQLDAATGLAVMELLRAVVRSEGVTALVATHDPQLLGLADRVLELSDGAVVEE
ncbi:MULTISPECIES: ATP-binding cassette domain-containing protein [unclassified Streptomyces]|uniref:ATP-binding cassette domain-containing protein n=1 Tax=Streptomyces sp. Ag82_O1-12 TaxID=1938854 RepID=UPI00211BE47D|nr:MULTISPECIES: ATP-binding cassette domain-containing protein [unclassified Streptomyces]